jgi:predicted RND superfamily exporter protein
MGVQKCLAPIAPGPSSHCPSDCTHPTRCFPQATTGLHRLRHTVGDRDPAEMTEPLPSTDAPASFSSSRVKAWPRSLRWTVIVVTVLLSLGSIWPLLHLRFADDVRQWLPEGDPQARLLSWFEQHFSTGDVVFLSWDDARLGDDRLTRVASALRKIHDVEQVRTPPELLDQMTRAFVPRAEARRRLTGVLIGARHEGERPAGLLVTLAPPNDRTREERLEELRAVAESQGVPRATLRLGGGPVTGAELDKQLEYVRWNPQAPWTAPHRRSPLLASVVASAIAAVVLLRRPRLAFTVLMIAVLGTAVATAGVPLTGGRMHTVLIVMPTLLLTLTLSAAIHVANYWRRAGDRVGDRALAAALAWHAARRPCLLATLTTAIGLASLLTSPLSPVRDFALYSAVGVTIGLAFALLSLPAVLATLPVGQPHAPGGPARLWKPFGQRVGRHGTLLVTVALITALACALGLRHFRTQVHTISFFPHHSEVVADHRFLEQHIAGLLPIELVVVFDHDASERLSFMQRVGVVRSVEEALRRHPDVTGAIGLPDFIATHDEFAWAVQHRFWVADWITQFFGWPDGAMTTLFTAYGWPIYLAAAESSASEGDAVEFLQAAHAPVLARRGEPLAQRGDQLWRIAAQASIFAEHDANALLNEIRTLGREAIANDDGVRLLVTGTMPLFLRTQEAVVESLIYSFALAFAVIAVVMAIVLRSLVAGLVAMLPNLFPMAVVFGALAWARVEFDVGMMVTASVALGIAIDGTLHLLTWYRRGLEDGKSRPEAMSDALAHCGPALFQTSLVVGLGMAVLGYAELLLVTRFGLLMAALVAAALIADVIVLPALICSPLGRAFGNPVKNPDMVATQGTRPVG